MKKLITIILALILSLSAFACTPPENNNDNNGQNNPPNDPLIQKTLEEKKAELLDDANKYCNYEIKRGIKVNIASTLKSPLGLPSREYGIRSRCDGYRPLYAAYINALLRLKADYEQEIAAVETEDDLEYFYRESSMLEKVYGFMEEYPDYDIISNKNNFKPDPWEFGGRFTSQIDGEQISVCSDLRQGSLSNRWEVSVEAESADIEWYFVTDEYTNAYANYGDNGTLLWQEKGGYSSSGSLSENAFALMEHFANHNKSEYLRYYDGFFGVIFVKNGVIRGYTAFDVDMDWYRSVTFDDANSLLGSDVVDLIKKARDGQDGEAQAGLNVEYNHVEIFSGRNMGHLDVVIHPLYSEDGKQSAIVFNRSTDGNEYSYKVYSDESFMLNGSNVCEATATFGDEVVVRNDKSSTIGVVIYVDSEVRGYVVIKITDSESPCNAPPIISGKYYVHVTNQPKMSESIARDFVDYYSGKMFENEEFCRLYEQFTDADFWIQDEELYKETIDFFQ